MERSLLCSKGKTTLFFLGASRHRQTRGEAERTRTIIPVRVGFSLSHVQRAFPNCAKEKPNNLQWGKMEGFGGGKKSGEFLSLGRCVGLNFPSLGVAVDSREESGSSPDFGGGFFYRSVNRRAADWNSSEFPHKEEEDSRFLSRLHDGCSLSQLERCYQLYHRA